ncbi:MAG: deoxyribose-phosphate aldolase [Treponema sp.]|nr:deoxyribose-phosphate aldolase [Treponema sp.]
MQNPCFSEEAIFGYIDYTLLKAVTSWEDIKTLCDEAVRFKTASVCVPPVYVKRIRDAYGERLNICTVIGFPLGYSVTAAKALETKQALADGASEIDMVINIGDVKNGEYNLVLKEIKTIKEICGDAILKVIIETCYLSEAEKIHLCRIVTEAKADYIKTSTGFGPAGAVLADIALFKKHIGPNVKIKAAGGIKTREDMEAFINAGADRIGTSSAASLFT